MPSFVITLGKVSVRVLIYPGHPEVEKVKNRAAGHKRKSSCPNSTEQSVKMKDRIANILIH